MAFFRWQQGRQKSGYKKMLLATGKWPRPFDLYLLRFDTGSEIQPHVDSVSNGEHHRVNIVLKKAKQGGEFICESALYESSRVKYFRPDLAEHQVTRVAEGRRYVLSFGWIG